MLRGPGPLQEPVTSWMLRAGERWQTAERESSVSDFFTECVFELKSSGEDIGGLARSFSVLATSATGGSCAGGTPDAVGGTSCWAGGSAAAWVGDRGCVETGV